MKTAVSIPDELFRKAEKEARRRKISRSALITRALEHYLAPGDDEITRKLNEVYSRESSALDPLLVEMQARATRTDEKW
ncbi:MAG: ribbon-helix-helix protein, CopG family [Deltaproteobacteria bacterium]|nr:ribbon-helix-helix protein, CopG family [Deltaproteobacteria bacterium]